jgi:hypothetical protein
MFRFTLLLIAIVSSASRASAPAPCSSAEHRQFDFWSGEWRVQTPDGKFAGINRITVEYGGCVIHERYVTGRGYSGESLNSYDAGRKVWHQTWVDNTGLLLILEGRWDGNSMTLEGKAPNSKGVLTKQRITWTPNTDGSLRQLWESQDAKGPWSVVFDGRYTKK